jgi:hypothetical protein
MRVISAQRINAVSSSSVCGRTVQADTMISSHSSSLKKFGKGKWIEPFDFLAFMY